MYFQLTDVYIFYSILICIPLNTKTTYFFRSETFSKYIWMKPILIQRFKWMRDPIHTYTFYYWSNPQYPLVTPVAVPLHKWKGGTERGNLTFSYFYI